jgi:phosphate transport system protein
MNTTGIGGHISQQFNEELEDVRNRVLKMGGMVEKQLADAVKALIDGDKAGAEKVIENDFKVNAMEVALDEECTRIIARRQPAASDLRLLVAIIKTITDLERIGDEAERVARAASNITQNDLRRVFFAELQHMGDLVSVMLHKALDAFARTDVDLAFVVLDSDEQVDREYEATIRHLITFMTEDARSIPTALDILWAARALERIGDRSRNICEYVVYFVKGKDVRHTSLEDVRAELTRKS